MRLRPGGIVGVSKFSDIVTFYDKSFVENLKADTPFAKCPEMRHVSMRQWFHYTTETYKGHIHTATENLLTWEPMAFTIGLIALVVAIAVWVIR